MFLAAKILAFATQPVAWALLLLAASLVASHRWPRLGRRLSASALFVLVLVGWKMPSEALLYRMETVHPAMAVNIDLRPYVGVIVLGGALNNAHAWTVPGRISLNESGERMIVPVSLMQRYPHLKLLFTGGSGNLLKEKLTEADRAKILFDSLGVDPTRVLYESASRTTYENGLLSAKLPGVDIRQRWLLLTTAAHMPRSMAVFQKQGWNVTAYPVDFQGSDDARWYDYDLREGIYAWHYALHELIGYAMYRLTGRI